MSLHDRRLLTVLFVVVAAAARLGVAAGPSESAAGSAGDLDPARIEFFEKKIRPALIEHCYSCHSAEADKIKGKLRVDHREGLLVGGESGPAVVPGKPDESLLVQAVRWQDDMQMPPKKKLPDAVIADLVLWVKMGAPDPRRGDAKPVAVEDHLNLDKARQFWSFRPVADVAPPAVRDEAWVQTEIDRFILARLEEQNLRPVEPADRRTLIRRATFDLIGLPPTPEEVSAFVSDPAPTPRAFAKVVDRLLASPHYGERWGRHWMDLVRYADTAGDNSDYPVPDLFRYRNYVIDSLNADKPYDQFLREQIAGDLLPADSADRRYDQIVGTGYIALARRFGSLAKDYPQYLTIEDTIDNLGRTVLGLTVSCARCHDHKFDAIYQEDYYRLYGIFNSTRYPFPGIELDKRPKDFVPLVPEGEVAQFEKDAGRIKELERDVPKLKKDRTAAEKDESDKGKAKLKDVTERLAAAERELGALYKKREKVHLAYAVAEGDVGDAKMHIRGDPEKLGKDVPRGFLKVLGGQTLTDEQKKSSGRLQLAEWLTDPANPLTARVMVNRVWHYHFGRGIVRTPSDFGVRGTPPTHPELLDYLAKSFVDNGWSLKALHRQIMLSRVYQLSGADDEANHAVDPDNSAFWRMNRRRLDAETLRDTLLVLGGNLDASMPREPHPFPPSQRWNYTQHYPFKETYPSNRRSVYLMTARLNALPFFTTFDGADRNASTAARDSSVTTIQALYMLNDPFVHEQAARFADRLRAERKDEAGRIHRSFELALGRAPTDEEVRGAAALLAEVTDRLRPAAKSSEEAEKQAWASYCRVLLRINEFLYVD